MTLADPVFLTDRLAYWAEMKPDEIEKAKAAAAAYTFKTK